MPGITVGDRAPSFRLPSAQGPEMGLDDFHGRQNVIVWFTKGMGCAFCRAQMSQLARSHDEIRARGAEVLEISVSKLPSARAYAQKFRLPFSYLCDPDYRVREAWQLAAPAYGPVQAMRSMMIGVTNKPGPSDFAMSNFAPMDEMRNMLRPDEMGFFIVDKQGIVRYSLAGEYLTAKGSRAIPSGAEIVKELDALG